MRQTSRALKGTAARFRFPLHPPLRAQHPGKEGREARPAVSDRARSHHTETLIQSTEAGEGIKRWAQ